jgi:hypothetical protein
MVFAMVAPRLLSRRDALELVVQAHQDFPGLDIYLLPVVAPRPMTEDLVIRGYALIVRDPRGRGPQFELRDVVSYDYLYESVIAHYEALEQEREAREQAAKPRRRQKKGHDVVTLVRPEESVEQQV